MYTAPVTDELEAEPREVKAFRDFYSKLVKVLPMNSISDLYSHNLLPGDHKERIDALNTQKQKAEYFLDRVIKPGVEIGYTGQFDEMLKVMENSDDPPVRFLATEIKKFTSSVTSSKETTSLNVARGPGRFSSLHPTKDPTGKLRDELIGSVKDLCIVDQSCPDHFSLRFVFWVGVGPPRPNKKSGLDMRLVNF